MVRKILAGSRFMIAIPVIGSFIGSLVTLVYGGITTVKVATETFAYPTFDMAGVKHLSVDFIELIDIYLLGTVLYIIALGLYELFIDPKLPMPPWLHIDSLEHLKEKLLGVIMVLLGVSFLGEVTEWDGDGTILNLGIAIGAVIFAFTLMLALPLLHQRGDHTDHSE